MFFVPKSIPKNFSERNKALILKLYESFLNLLFPFYCFQCQNFTSQTYLCQTCLKNIDFYLKVFCPQCRKRRPLIDDFKEACCSNLIKSVISFVSYQKECIAQLIKLGKYEGYYQIFNFFAQLIFLEIKKLNLNLKNFYLSFVPLSPKEYLKRGFNQSEILAQFLSKNLELPIYQGLIKIKITRRQADLNFEERQKNLNGAFTCLQKAPKNILLIDDIITTGTTLRESAKVLKEKGAQNIIGLTIAFQK